MEAHGQGRARESGAGLIVIGVFKLVKVAMLVTLGVLALKAQRDTDLPEMLMRWGTVYTGPHVQHLVTLLAGKVAETDAHKMRELAAAAFIYAAVFSVEGTGLLLRKRWAEYLTLIVTASLLPFEIYECIHHFTATKLTTLVVNVAVLVYLFWKVRHREAREPSSRHRPQPVHA